jgi:hypothetical protein
VAASSPPRQPSKSVLGNPTQEVLESEEYVGDVWESWECRVCLWGIVFDG